MALAHKNRITITVFGCKWFFFVFHSGVNLAVRLNFSCICKTLPWLLQLSLFGLLLAFKWQASKDDITANYGCYIASLYVKSNEVLHLPKQRHTIVDCSRRSVKVHYLQFFNCIDAIFRHQIENKMFVCCSSRVKIQFCLQSFYCRNSGRVHPVVFVWWKTLWYWQTLVAAAMWRPLVRCARNGCIRTPHLPTQESWDTWISPADNRRSDQAGLMACLLLQCRTRWTLVLRFGLLGCPVPPVHH